MSREPTRLRRWAAVVGLSADQLVAWGVLYYAYSVLSAPIARDLGVSSRVVAGAFSGTLLVSGLLTRPIGRVLDRDGARPVLLVGAVIGPVALAMLAGVRQDLPLFLVFAALGVAHSLSLYEPAFRAVVDWFPAETERTRALLVLTSVAGLASTVFLPFTAFLVDRCGWRVAVAILAVLVAVVTLPVRLALPARIRTAPTHGPRPRIAAASSPVANVLGAGFALQTFASTGATVALVWQLVERGEPLATAAMLAGLAGASQVPGRLLLAPLRRAVRTELRLPALFVVQAGALVGLAVASGPALWLAVFCFGAAGGIMTLERATVVLEWFGRDSFGARSGHIASIAFLARAGSPFAVELLHGTTSYAGVFGLLALALVGGGVVVGVAHRLRRP